MNNDNITNLYNKIKKSFFITIFFHKCKGIEKLMIGKGKRAMKEEQ